ncbi:hypothetical protein B0H11DRAFT_2296252 [Mycena galericulata]|nr:hypothetical protein B0H11DRAFT_2296252 [Mycena galericulata]
MDSKPAFLQESNPELRRNGKTYVKARALVFLLPLLCWAYWSPFSVLEPSPAIDWKPCREDPSFLCGYFDVPTDYKNPSAGTSKLALTNYPATCPRSERLGVIITNFGGPGVPGRDASFTRAAYIQNVTGNRHDIISFDQRGLGHSIPKVDCFGTAQKYERFKANTVFETTFSVPEDPFSPEGRAVLVEQQKQALALEEVQGALCDETMGSEALGYMSTTTTIYDMEEISRVLVGEDALINFWGGSYGELGSIVGAYLGNMLPNKAGKIYIDGLVPADMWANEYYDSQVLLRLLLTDSEKTYQLFLSECFDAGSEYCALRTADDTSVQDIEKRIDDFISRVQAQPMRVDDYTSPGYITSGGVRSTIFLALQIPEEWGPLVGMLASAINDGDGVPLKRFISRGYGAPAPPDPEGYTETGQGELLRLAISCGDARPYQPGEKGPTAEEIVDNILVTMEKAPRFGATVHLMEQHGGCQYWPGTGVGPPRFTGPFNKTLATPTLIHASTHDAITPYAAAKIVHETMGNSSRLLLQGSIGHAYLAPTTKCSAKVIRSYFVDGVIPDEPETFCPREVDNFFVDQANRGVRSSSKYLPSFLGRNVTY